MTGQQAIAFGVLGLTLVMFVWGRWRYDVVATFALLAVVIAASCPQRTPSTASLTPRSSPLRPC